MDGKLNGILIEGIKDFVANSAENTLNLEAPEKAWDEVIVGFADGKDPIFESFKDHVGEFHWTPAEAFSIANPDLQEDFAELTVISWVLPQREATKKDNRKETFFPSRRWVMARFPGEEFNNALRRQVVTILQRQGIKAVAPLLLPEWKREISPQYGFASRWSERHAAYASGLGTFGLCDGLITERGKAHRVGSVIANISFQATVRPYANHHAYCLFFFDGSCSACRKRCPVGAISEHGHDKIKCSSHIRGACAEYVKAQFAFDGYGCGLCQTSVPCESGIPLKIRKHLTQIGTMKSSS